MSYVALMRLNPSSSTKDHPFRVGMHGDPAYAVGPFDDQPQAHTYGIQKHLHPHERHGHFLGTAELVAPDDYERIPPSPVVSFSKPQDPGADADAEIAFTTNLGHTGTLKPTDQGWQAAGMTPDGEVFAVVLAGPGEQAVDAKLRLLRAVDADQLPSFPPPGSP